MTKLYFSWFILFKTLLISLDYVFYISVFIFLTVIKDVFVRILKIIFVFPQKLKAIHMCPVT